MNASTETRSSARRVLPRMLLGAAIAAAAVILALFFDASGPAAPEGPAYRMGLAGLASPLLVLAAVLAFSWLPSEAVRREAKEGAAFQAWRAASTAIHFWALSMACISIILTLFLGTASDAMGWTGALDGDFPRVVINDFQENSSCALMLVALYYGLSFSYLRRRGRL